MGLFGTTPAGNSRQVVVTAGGALIADTMAAAGTPTANTPSIASAATALSSNPSRRGFQIQNVGTNPLFVLLGTGASSSVYHAVLKGGTANSDGLGGSIAQLNGVVYTGVVTIAGTAPLYVITEL